MENKDVRQMARELILRAKAEKIANIMTRIAGEKENIQKIEKRIEEMEQAIDDIEQKELASCEGDYLRFN